MSSQVHKTPQWQSARPIKLNQEDLLDVEVNILPAVQPEICTSLASFGTRQIVTVTVAEAPQRQDNDQDFEEKVPCEKPGVSNSLMKASPVSQVNTHNRFNSVASLPPQPQKQPVRADVRKQSKGENSGITKRLEPLSQGIEPGHPIDDQPTSPTRGPMRSRSIQPLPGAPHTFEDHTDVSLPAPNSHEKPKGQRPNKLTALPLKAEMISPSPPGICAPRDVGRRDTALLPIPLLNSGEDPTATPAKVIPRAISHISPTVSPQKRDEQKLVDHTMLLSCGAGLKPLAHRPASSPGQIMSNSSSPLALSKAALHHLPRSDSSEVLPHGRPALAPLQSEARKSLPAPPSCTTHEVMDAADSRPGSVSGPVPRHDAKPLRRRTLDPLELSSQTQPHHGTDI